MRDADFTRWRTARYFEIFKADGSPQYFERVQIMTSPRKFPKLLSEEELLKIYSNPPLKRKR